MGLTNTQQAIFVFLSAVVATLAGWATAGFPTDRLAVGAVVAALLIGVGLAIKEYAGTATTTPTTPTTQPAATATKATTPTAFFKLKRRLIFLQLRQ